MTTNQQEFWDKLVGTASSEAIAKTREWLKYWDEISDEFLLNLPDEQFEQLHTNNRAQYGIPEDEALAAMLAATNAKVGFGRIEDAPKPDLVN